jgi:hypothetical protein
MAAVTKNRNFFNCPLLLYWFSGFREEDLNVIFYQNMSNLHNRYKSAERKISQKNPEYMLNYSLPCSCSYKIGYTMRIFQYVFICFKNIFGFRHCLDWRNGTLEMVCRDNHYKMSLSNTKLFLSGRQGTPLPYLGPVPL